MSNARGKRAHHGCEKDWNKYDEPFRRMLGGIFKINDGWVAVKTKLHIWKQMKKDINESKS